MRSDIIETDLCIRYYSDALKKDKLSSVDGITTDSRLVKKK